MTVEPTLGTTLALGFVLGLRHAGDPDHVAAVSAYVMERRGLRRAWLVATWWGVGHTAALLAAALAVSVLRLSIAPALERGFELLVGAALVLLGLDVLWRALGTVAVHRHSHAHGAVTHSHVHGHWGLGDGHAHGHWPSPGLRPFLFGVLHGLAGSGALTVLAVAALPSVPGVALYVLVFGIGSTAGMVGLSGLLALPLAISARRSRAWRIAIQAAAGAASVVVGVRLALMAAAG